MFFEDRARVQHVATFLHKLTGWPRVGLLHAAFPDAYFIHVHREMSATARSWLRQSWFDHRRSFGRPSETIGLDSQADAEAVWRMLMTATSRRSTRSNLDTG
ncbi:MAG: sulfotransferase [Candidatus Dormibacteria bacterium]